MTSRADLSRSDAATEVGTGVTTGAIPGASADATTDATTDADRLAARDRVWLRATAQGDRSAFEALYRHHHGRLARFLGRFTTRRDLIDDVVNDTLWVVWRQAAGFRGDSKVSTWITGIAYRCMLKALRATAPAEEVTESALGNELTLDDVAAGASAVAGSPEADRELRDWLRHGLATLPDEQRITMELAYYLGESCEGIAVIMGCAVGTVKARMFHARVRLRNVLPALGGTRPAAGREAR